MTKEARKQQIRDRLIVAGLVAADILGIALFIGGCERVMAEESAAVPVAGFTAYINSIDLDHVVIEPEEVVVLETTEPEVSDDDLYLLSHLIYAEAGADYIQDSSLYAVGSVCLNRVNSSMYPDSLYEVIFQPGQYSCTWNGAFYKNPSQRAYDIAKDLLINGSTLPGNVLGQASFVPSGWTEYMYQDGIYFSSYK